MNCKETSSQSDFLVILGTARRFVPLEINALWVEPPGRNLLEATAYENHGQKVFINIYM